MSKRSAKEIVGQCQRLFEDLDFRTAREWKDARPGRKVIGYMPVHVPRQIIHAAGMLPLGIPGGDIGMEAAIDDQSDTCRIQHSALDLADKGKFGFLDGIILPSFCDVSGVLSGSSNPAFRKKYLSNFETPQNVGGTFFYDQLKEFKEGLEKLGGRKIPEADINHSIAVYNENRRWVHKVYDYRAEKPWKAPSSEVYLLMRAGMVMEVEDHTLLMQEYLTATEAEERSAADLCRVALTGAYCGQPPLEMIKSLEAAGCYIVDDDFVFVNRWIKGDIPNAGDPLQNLAKAFVQQSSQAAAQHTKEVGLRGAYLLESVKQRGAQGIVFAAPSCCQPAVDARTALVDVLNSRKIPHLTVKDAETSGLRHIGKEVASFAG